jgi:DNA-binding transcriptional ArsR family regulator
MIAGSVPSGEAGESGGALRRQRAKHRPGRDARIRPDLRFRATLFSSSRREVQVMTAAIVPPLVDPALERSLETLKALSGGERLRILTVLLKAETCVCDLEHLGMSTALLSYHLRKLREMGLVRTRRDAQWVYYSIDPEAWTSFASPLAAFFGAASLPPEAEMGAGQRCDPAPGASGCC